MENPLPSRFPVRQPQLSIVMRLEKELALKWFRADLVCANLNIEEETPGGRAI